MISDLLSRLWWRSPAAPAVSVETVESVKIDERNTNSAQSDLRSPLTTAIPRAAVDIVAHFEGFRSDAYLCPAGVYTMGYGSTRAAEGAPVRPGMRVSEAEARALLMRDLAGAAKAVDRLVTVPLEEHERAALVSFIYNVGQGAFADSTLLKMLNADARTGAAAQFGRWDKSRGKVLAGLTRRRAAEAAMFLGLDWRAAAAASSAPSDAGGES